jgi:hypothetical protein
VRERNNVRMKARNKGVDLDVSVSGNLAGMKRPSGKQRIYAWNVADAHEARQLTSVTTSAHYYQR